MLLAQRAEGELGFLMKTGQERPGNIVGVKRLRGERLEPDIPGPAPALLLNVRLVMV